MQRNVAASWEFHCPECGFGHRELSRLANDHETHCEICEHEDGRIVILQRWAGEQPPVPSDAKSG